MTRAVCRPARHWRCAMPMSAGAHAGGYLLQNRCTNGRWARWVLCCTPLATPVSDEEGRCPKSRTPWGALPQALHTTDRSHLDLGTNNCLYSRAPCRGQGRCCLSGCAFACPGSHQKKELNSHCRLLPHHHCLVADVRVDLPQAIKAPPRGRHQPADRFLPHHEAQWPIPPWLPGPQVPQTTHRRASLAEPAHSEHERWGHAAFAAPSMPGYIHPGQAATSLQWAG
mmetsp:Transcript_43673/g.86634  ORF Transcript_43673/g.86634 Transcript_43673/m.86634 type:complete len:226 (-) Transcript_43673:838-1515(-)